MKGKFQPKGGLTRVQKKLPELLTRLRPRRHPLDRETLFPGSAQALQTKSCSQSIFSFL